MVIALNNYIGENENQLASVSASSTNLALHYGQEGKGVDRVFLFQRSSSHPRSLCVGISTEEGRRGSRSLACRSEGGPVGQVSVAQGFSVECPTARSPINRTKWDF